MKLRLLLALLVSGMFAGAALAQTPISGTITCTKPDPMNAVEAGDRTGHSYIAAKTACTWTKGMEIAGSTSKSGGSAWSGEMNSGKSTASGTHWSEMANGDKFFVRFHGAGSVDKNGVVEKDNGTWSFAGGTGKLKGITGKGSYAGKGSADGSVTYEITGNYSLPAVK